MGYTPLVTVICIGYNQAPFLREAVESAMRQDYAPLQVIVADDGSRDGSDSIAMELKREYPTIELLLLPDNGGYCRIFNKALAMAKGKYIMDLAADDVLLPECIRTGVLALEKAGPEYALHFSDADYINEKGDFLYRHSQRFPHATIPQGDVYRALVRKYFICPPTMMFRRDVLEALGGYDEQLDYEDFDLWIRLSRTFKFCYSPHVLVRKRELEHSMAKAQFIKGGRHSRTTYEVCKKIFALNRNRAEAWALAWRLAYEGLYSVKVYDFTMAMKYAWLFLKNVPRCMALNGD